MANPIAEMLGELRAQGRETLRGGFTLDREKAREKMSSFSLADPRSYVLELLQAAVLMQGAAIRGRVVQAADNGPLLADEVTSIRFDIDSDDMHLRFDGEPFTETDFDLIYASLFSGGVDRLSQARRQLALGLNAALALNPRYVRVVSGDAEGSALLEMRPGKPDHYETREEPAEGTHIHVKSRFRPGLVVQFYRNVAGTIDEERLLKERCVRSWFPVDLEGRQLATGLALPEATDCFVIPSEGLLLGVVGFLPGSKSKAKLELHKNGVFIASHELDGLPLGLVAAVDAATLRKDVSQANVVVDDAYHDVVQQVARAAELPLAAMGKRILAEKAGAVEDPHRGWAWERLRDALRQQQSLETLVEAEEGSLGHALFRIPFWQSIDGRWWSLQHILAECEDAEVGYTSETYAEHLEALDRLFVSDARIVLYLPDVDDAAALTALFGARLTRQTDALQRLLKREENRRLWQSRRATAALSTLEGVRRYLGTRRVQARALRCQVGIPADLTEEFELYCVVDGHLLCRLAMPGAYHGVPSGVTAVVEAELTPNEMFDGVVGDAALGEGLEAVLHGMRGAFDRCVRGWFESRRSDPHRDPKHAKKLREKFLKREPEVRARVLDYLALVYEADFPSSFFHAFDVDPSPLNDRLQREPSRWRPALAAEGVDGEGVDAEPPPYDRLPLFATVGGDWLSVAALRHWLQQDGELRWVAEDRLKDADCRAHILWLSYSARKLLIAVFGEEHLREDVVGYRIARSEAIHLRKRAEPIAVKEHTSGSFVAHFIAGSLEGELGLWNRLLEPLGSLDVRLLRKHRLLENRRVLLSLPAGRAVVNGDGLPPAEDWDAVLDGPELSDVWVNLRRTGMQLLVHLAKHLGVTPETRRPDARELIRNGLRACFPPMLSDAFAKIRKRAADDGQALALYEDLLRPLGSVDAETLAALLEEALMVPSALPDPSRIFALLPAGSWPLEAAAASMDLDFTHCNERWDISVGPGGGATQVDPDNEYPLRRLLKTPLFPTNQGTFMSLEEMLDRNRAGEPVHFVHRYGAAELETDETVLMVSGPELELVRTVVGEDGVRHGGAILHEASRRKLFMAREVVDEVALRPEETVVWLPVDEDGMQGQVGLAVDPEAGSWIDLYKEKRHICRTAGFSTDGLLAAINDNRLTVKRDYTYVERNDRLKQVYRCCEALRAPLYEKLAECWESVDAVARRTHLPWLLEYFSEAVGDTFGQGETLSTPLLTRLAELPLLEAVGGGWHSLQDVRAVVQQTGSVSYLLSEREGELLEPSRVVVLANRLITLHLQRIFGSLRDYAGQWDDEQVLVALRHHGAPELPMDEPEGGLLGNAFRISPWDGYIYLPEDPDEELLIRFGVAGVEAMAWQPSRVFPCAGRFDTDKLRIYRRRQRGALTEAQERILERQGCSLYQTLASRFRSGQLTGQARESAQAYLRHALQRLHLLMGADGAEELNRYWRNLYGRLETQPLFPLDSGETISLQAALELRPPELAGYGLWDPQDADPAVGLTIGRTRVFPFALEPESPAEEATDAVLSQLDAAEPAPSEAARALDDLFDDFTPDEDMADDGPSEAVREDESLIEEPTEVVAVQDLEQVEERSAEERLVQALRAELEAHNTEDNRLLSDVPLVSIKLSPEPSECAATCDDWGITLHRAHPVVERLLDDAQPQPVLLSMLALGVYTVVNLHLEEVTDDHEAEFQHLAVQRIRERVFEEEGSESART